eukprot:CAMPEP_0115137918 /NCGR_PEP_ID=MMETSP0227-20121206/57352_1 /TAXON_ID=89957 /ORGANISM="Polarella glacialis, Strain CCMP 1383" /LENGTH=211 /DNA_ID=CAMNT_0002545429 /DNA_START=542 /DNA_END=1178 /DNA_ORIENTATION=-
MRGHSRHGFPASFRELPPVLPGRQLTCHSPRWFEFPLAGMEGAVALEEAFGRVLEAGVALAGLFEAPARQGLPSLPPLAAPRTIFFTPALPAVHNHQRLDRCFQAVGHQRISDEVVAEELGFQGFVHIGAPFDVSMKLMSALADTLARRYSSSCCPGTTPKVMAWSSASGSSLVLLMISHLVFSCTDKRVSLLGSASTSKMACFISALVMS